MIQLKMIFVSKKLWYLPVTSEPQSGDKPGRPQGHQLQEFIDLLTTVVHLTWLRFKDSDLMSLCPTVRFSEETFSLIQPGPGDYPRSLSALIATKGQTVAPGSYALRRESSCAPGFSKRYLIGAGSMPAHSTTDLLRLFRRVTVQKTSQVLFAKTMSANKVSIYDINRNVYFFSV